MPLHERLNMNTLRSIIWSLTRTSTWVWTFCRVGQQISELFSYSNKKDFLSRYVLWNWRIEKKIMVPRNLAGCWLEMVFAPLRITNLLWSSAVDFDIFLFQRRRNWAVMSTAIHSVKWTDWWIALMINWEHSSVKIASRDRSQTQTTSICAKVRNWFMIENRRLVKNSEWLLSVTAICA